MLKARGGELLEDLQVLEPKNTRELAIIIPIYKKRHKE